MQNAFKSFTEKKKIYKVLLMSADYVFASERCVRDTGRELPTQLGLRRRRNFGHDRRGSISKSLVQLSRRLAKRHGGTENATRRRRAVNMAKKYVDALRCRKIKCLR